MKNYLLGIFLLGISLSVGAQCSTVSAPTEDCSYGDQINSFIFNNVAATGNSGCGTNGYNSFASPVFTAQLGSTYNFSATTGSGMYNESFAMWIDLNNNGFFEASEQLVTKGANMTHTGTVTIPVTALSGTNRKMRIRCAYALTVNSNSLAATDACVSGLGSGYGETEDYNITLLCDPVPVIPSLTVTASNTLVCAGGTVNITASGATTYTWTGSITNGTTFTANATTIYSVTGSLGGCPNNTATAVKTISVSTTPATITVVASSPSLCAGSSVTLTATGASSFQTLPGSSTTSIVVVYPTANTTYTTIGTGGVCPGVAFTTISVSPAPVVTITASSPSVCVGGSVVLTASGGTNYLWDVIGSTSNSISVTPTVASSYSVTGTSASGCSAGTNQVILAISPPTISIAATKTLVCSGSSATLLASGANSYSWNTGPATNTISVNPTTATTYTVEGLLTNNVCPGTKTIEVSVFIPTLSVSNTSSVCLGTALTLTAGGASTYTWNNSVHSPTILITPSGNTVIIVSATSQSGVLSCVSQASITITVNPNPTVTAALSRTTMCVGETNTITANGASTYSWSNSTIGPKIVLTPTTAITSNYTVTGSDVNGCTSFTTISLKAGNCTGISEVSLKELEIMIYPNPNSGDFTVQSPVEITLTVVNELGQLIKNFNLSSQNNYKVSVNNLPNGIYFISGQNSEFRLNKKIVVSK